MIDYERACRALLIKPRKLRVVPVVNYLRDNSNYNSELPKAIVYSMVTPPYRRYYYWWVKEMLPKIDLEDKALFIGKEPLLINYKGLETTSLSKLKDEVMFLLMDYL